jgi:hypothetical protein
LETTELKQGNIPAVQVMKPEEPKTTNFNVSLEEYE